MEQSTLLMSSTWFNMFKVRQIDKERLWEKFINEIVEIKKKDFIKKDIIYNRDKKEIIINERLLYILNI